MRAQVAIEFMIIFGVFLVALTLVVFAAWNNIANISKSSVDFEANRILNLVSNRIDTVFLEGDGFSIGLNIQEKISVYNYTLDVEKDRLWLAVNNITYSKRLISPNITGTLQKGDNTIQNVDGVVVIS